ncbi:MAG: DUF5104 domain-containing protein [Clostridia bacterium]|nr:DUF5104 domain-containing protein [Clostridia bacterium]
MKKIATLMLVILVILATFSSCSDALLSFTSSDELAEKSMSSLLDALEEGNQKKVQRMFAKTAVRKAENFEKQVEDLFDFFKGDIQRWEISGGVVDGASFDFGWRVREIEGSCTVTTENGNYTILFRECVSDNLRWGNVGIHSLRVYHTEDEELYFPSIEEDGFVGKDWSLLQLPGIFTPQAPEVIIENEEDAMLKQVVDSINIWHKNGIKNAFAADVAEETEDFEEQLTALFDYYDGKYHSFERREYSEKEHLLHGNVVILETRAVYEVKTDKQDYLFIFYSTPKYNADPKMRGIQSLRVIREEDEAAYFPDWSVMDETQGIFVPKE